MAIKIRFMGRKSKFKLPELHLGNETFGQRLARIRKARGLTQVALAEKMGIIQPLITDYERDKLRMHAEMVVRFAMALNVSTDELLGLASKGKEEAVNLKLWKRVKRIEGLPDFQQKVLLKTIDTFLKGAEVDGQAVNF